MENLLSKKEILILVDALNYASLNVGKDESYEIRNKKLREIDRLKQKLKALKTDS
jgi:hypothetical protein